MTKSLINKLSNDIISRLNINILINRPSCVLKELIENSLDALSSSISVHLFGSGFKLIRVVDNGVGIYKDDLYKIGFHFSTSKICFIDDLNNIKTYGFRGESLAGINSISKLKIFSKPYDQLSSYVAVFDNIDVNVFPGAGVNGTTVEVKDLFYNKLNYNFFDNVDYEFYDNFYVFKFLALARFDVRFLFFCDGRELINLPICVDNYSKIKRIEYLNSNFCANDVLNINFFDSGMNFNGFIYINSLKCKNKYDKFFFVNNRFVNSNFLDKIFSDIFVLNKRKVFPFGYYLYLSLDTSLYSVLSSVKKIDIVFKDIDFIYKFLFKSLFTVFSNKFFISNKLKVTYNSCEDSISDRNSSFFSIKTSDKLLYENVNSVVTVLNNLNVFFILDKSFYFVKLHVIRERVIYNLFFSQFLKNGKILKKRVFCNIKIDLKVFSIFLKFKDFLLLYGMEFFVANDEFLVVCGIPVLFYNLYVNWNLLFFDLKDFLDRYSFSDFSKNRFDANVINVFIKSISKKSPCLSYEIKFFYKELLNAKIHDIGWFNQNCSEVFIK